MKYHEFEGLDLDHERGTSFYVRTKEGAFRVLHRSRQYFVCVDPGTLNERLIHHDAVQFVTAERRSVTVLYPKNGFVEDLPVLQRATGNDVAPKYGHRTHQKSDTT